MKNTATKVLCRNLNIPVVSAVPKHQLVHLTAEKRVEDPPDQPVHTTCAGEVPSIPAKTIGINHLNHCILKSVLLHRQLVLTTRGIADTDEIKTVNLKMSLHRSFSFLSHMRTRSLSL